jgi:hypothetical protein
MKPRAILGLLGALAAVGLLVSFTTTGENPMPGIPNPPIPTDEDFEIRNRIVAQAASQIGSTDPSPYWLDAFGSVPSSKLAWCGVFALWVLRMVGLTARKWVAGKGFIFVDDAGNAAAKPYLPIVKSPAMGDIAYFDKPYQHYALVEEVDGDTVHLIAGNTPNVGRQKTTISSGKAVFFSVAPLLPSSPPTLRAA